MTRDNAARVPWFDQPLPTRPLVPPPQEESAHHCVCGCPFLRHDRALVQRLANGDVHVVSLTGCSCGCTAYEPDDGSETSLGNGNPAGETYDGRYKKCQ